MSETSAATSLDRLNEKEREVLRLFGRGHDAKSTASSLGLSVHTINERLRTARRKLDVTSSREAARLLSEIEGEGRPEKLGSKEMGDAPSGSAPDPKGSAATFRSPTLWIGGFFVMLTLTLAAVLVASSQSASERQVGDPATAIENVQANEWKRVASAWLTLVDLGVEEGDWQSSFDAAGKSFREPNTVATWRDASQLARVPLGSVVTRTPTHVEFVNAPPNGYAVVVFKTDFERRKGAVERVTLEREESGWKAVAYVID